MLTWKVLRIVVIIWLGLSITRVSAQVLAKITAENVAQVTQLGRLGYGAIRDIAFSPDGAYFAVGTRVGVALYTADDFLQPPRFLEGSTSSVVFDPTSRLLVTDGHLWDMETGGLLREFEGAYPAFTSDGEHIVFVDGQALVVQDAATGEELARQNVSEDIFGMRLSSDGSTVALEMSQAFVLWDIEKGEEGIDLALPSVMQFSIGLPAFSPDGTLLVQTGFDGFAIWDVESGAIITQTDSWFNPSLEGSAFTPDGTGVAIGDANAYVTVYDLLNTDAENGGAVPTPQQANSTEWRTRFQHDDEITAVAFSHDGKLLAAAAINGVVEIWNTETGRDHARLVGFSGVGRAISFDQYDDLLSLAAIGGAAWQWDVATGQQVSAAQGYKFYVSHGTIPYPSAIAINHAGNLLATGSVIEGNIHLWTPRGRSRGNLELGAPQDVFDLTFTVDDRLIAVLAHGGVYFWNLETGKRAEGLVTRDRWLRDLAVSPDGTLVAVGDAMGMATIQERETARYVSEFQGSEGDVTNLTFSPDGKYLVFTNACYCALDERDYSIRLWDIEIGELLHTFSGHEGFVEGIAFSPDGSVIASIANDATLRWWNVATGEEIAVIQEGATALAFNHAGTLLATSSRNGVVRLWGLASAS